MQSRPDKPPVEPEGKELKPGELAQLAKAWDTLEERKRVLRMKPAPKPVEVSVKPTKPKQVSFTET